MSWEVVSGLDDLCLAPLGSVMDRHGRKAMAEVFNGGSSTPWERDSWIVSPCLRLRPAARSGVEPEGTRTGRRARLLRGPANASSEAS